MACKKRHGCQRFSSQKQFRDQQHLVCFPIRYSIESLSGKRPVTVRCWVHLADGIHVKNDAHSPFCPSNKNRTSRSQSRKNRQWKPASKRSTAHSSATPFACSNRAIARCIFQRIWRQHFELRVLIPSRNIFA